VTQAHMDQIEKQIGQLNKIIDDLKNIHQFEGDPYYHINKTILEIDARVNQNAKKVDQYRALKKLKNSSQLKRIDLGLDIYSENFTIVNQKNELFDFYIKDIYERIEKIGKSITTQSHILLKISDTLKDLVEEKAQ
tara:strand:+ start:331 stop:738 length:408 start_codon:yes stop_codon:yes gene_type:complete